MSKTIEIVIGKDGSVTSTTKGFQGKTCSDASKFLEQALGETIKDEKTKEYYQSETTTNEQVRA